MTTSFRDLKESARRAMDWLVEIYRVTKAFPIDETIRADKSTPPCSQYSRDRIEQRRSWKRRRRQRLSATAPRRRARLTSDETGGATVDIALSDWPAPSRMSTRRLTAARQQAWAARSMACLDKVKAELQTPRTSSLPATATSYSTYFGAFGSRACVAMSCSIQSWAPVSFRKISSRFRLTFDCSTLNSNEGVLPVVRSSG